MNVPLTLWACGTAGHVALTGVWLHRSGINRSRDEFWFSWMLVSTGTLVSAIHISALGPGLTLTTGLATLACFHAGAALIDWRRRPAAVRESPTESLGVLERLAIVALCTVGVSWTLNATQSLDVIGTDAAHYHVPAAVNLALGSHLFALPATSNLYPLVSSALVAWFILPLHDPLLIDVAMLLPFFLLASAAAWTFRLVTGLSGVAWTTWLILALFSTPLFRAASLVSADLMFAAAYVGLLALLLSLLRGAHRPVALPLAGLATGLLLGSKTTGLPAAILLWSAFLALRAVIGEAPPRVSRRRVAGALVGAGVLSIAAGGIWLVRNWVVWGSPIAPTGLTIAGVEIFQGLPFETSDYLSILGDQNKDPAYPLWSRLASYIGIWLGSWYLLAMVPAAILIVDALTAWTRSRPEAGSRLAVISLVVLSGAPLAWLLAGAPWTSLEWTAGFSLRYVLPLAALFPLLALLGCFPSTYPWFTRRTWAVGVGAVFAAAAIMLLVRSHEPNSGNPPRIEWLPLAIVSGLTAGYGIVRRRPYRRVALTLALSVLAGAWTAVVSSRDIGAREDAARREASDPAADRAVYRKLLQAEQTRGLPCTSRRIFVLVRFDAPLTLQSIEYRNQVFYAARDLDVTARADPLTRCDYILTTRAVMATDKGQRLIATLNRFGQTSEIAEAPPLVVLGRR